MTWDPRQYERYRKEREQPFEDLLALIHRRTEMSVIDLGYSFKCILFWAKLAG